MADYYPEDKTQSTQFVKALGRLGNGIGRKLGIASNYQGGGSIPQSRERTYKNESGNDVTVTKANDTKPM
jgi:hypothetical protein